MRESKFFVKRDAGCVGGINATDQRVQAGSGGLVQNCVEQRLADALAAKTVIDVDRVFGRKAIRREWAKWPPRRKACQNARFLHDTQHRQPSGLLARKPCQHHFGTAWFVFVERSRVQNRVIVNRANGIKVLASTANHPVFFS